MAEFERTRLRERTADPRSEASCEDVHRRAARRDRCRFHQRPRLAHARVWFAEHECRCRGKDFQNAGLTGCRSRHLTISSDEMGARAICRLCRVRDLDKIPSHERAPQTRRGVAFKLNIPAGAVTSETGRESIGFSDFTPRCADGGARRQSFRPNESADDGNSRIGETSFNKLKGI
jgi:hypothetical protein